MSKKTTKQEATKVAPVTPTPITPELPLAPEIPLIPLEPSKPIYYIVAKLDSNSNVVGLYSTREQEIIEGDFKLRVGTDYSYSGLFDMIGRPNYKVTEVPITSSRPVLDESGEQVFKEEIQEFPVLDENGEQVFEEIIDELGNVSLVPKVETKPVQVPVFEEYESGSKLDMILRTTEDKDKDRAQTDPQIASLLLNDATILLGEAQQNLQLNSQKATNANLLLEIAQLRAKITQLEGGMK